MMGPRLLRFWQRANAWSICIGGTVTWWATNDRGVRTRKIDIEIKVPDAVWRPYCWAVHAHRADNPAGAEYYGYCVYCRKVPKAWAARNPYTRRRLRNGATSGRAGEGT